MAFSAGVGKSSNPDPFTAGSSAAKSALEAAGLQQCDFVLLFSTIGYDQQAVLDGVNSVTGNTPLSGCSGEGIITQDGPAGEVSFALSGAESDKDVVGVMVFASDELTFSNFLVTDLKADSLGAGERIGMTLNENPAESPLFLLMFPDSYTVNTHRLFSGIESKLKKPLPFCGGSSAHNLAFSDITYQYHNNTLLRDAVPCVLIAGTLNVALGVNHGCVPIGIEKRVTKAKDNIVFEVENTPAWKFYQAYLGDDLEQLNSECAPSVSFGVKLSDALSTEYDQYIVRAPLLTNPDGSILFSAEIGQGTTVQLVRRDESKISAGAQKMARELKKSLGGKKPVAVLHFDCAARGRMFFGDDVKEKAIDVLQDELGKDIPWLGFFSFGEIAPINGSNYYHNHTAALCVLY